jgi:hypothetical protein
MRATVVGTMMAIVVCLATAAVAAAAEGEPPCLADVKRLCANVPPTGNFVQGCLEAHSENLSTACRKRVGQVTRDGEALGTACRSDLDRFCANLPIAAGAKDTCLVKHRDALSTKCRDALDEQADQ